MIIDFIHKESVLVVFLVLFTQLCNDNSMFDIVLKSFTRLVSIQE
jgi:hypothetical protein